MVTGTLLTLRFQILLNKKVGITIDFLFNLVERKSVMSNCLEKQTGAFRLYDSFSEDVDSYTVVDVEVKRLKYPKQIEYYDISYTYGFSIGNESRQLGHPFVGNPDLDGHESGEIIVVNELSTVLVKFLLMSIDELSLHCGRVTPNDYKITVMHAISRLWD